jgi:serine protease DegQ
MRKLWLVFSQAATIALAVLFVVSTLRPDLLPGPGRGGGVVTVRETAAPEGGPRTVASYGDAARKAMPAVVNVFTSKEVKMTGHPLMNDPLFKFFFGDRFDGETQRASSLGSGVIASPEGYVLTNHHVVEAADEIEVALADGRTAKAVIVGSDPESDLAVVRIDLKELPAITFGRSDQVKVGDVVLAIGNPLGVGQTVTMGIVSATGRTGLGINTFENFIQTDAAINQGNSGGALVDAGGNLIGINTAILSRTGGNIGIGFAIPTSLARQVMEQIIQTGSVTRGWIGVEVQDLTADLAESFRVPGGKGVLIAGVIPGSPADQGGVRRGDVLVAVEGKPVAGASGMLNLIAALEPGRPAGLTVLRNQTEVQLRVSVGRRPRISPQRE